MAILGPGRRAPGLQARQGAAVDGQARLSFPRDASAASASRNGLAGGLIGGKAPGVAMRIQARLAAASVSSRCLRIGLRFKSLLVLYFIMFVFMKNFMDFCLNYTCEVLAYPL
jgi:hypothetical protein